MSIAGWYPDPAGQPGKFRYWDGRIWSQEVTTDPASPPPTSPAPGTTGTTFGKEHSGTAGWWVAGTIAVVILGLVVWGIVAVLPNVTGSNPWGPNGDPSQDLCNTGLIDVASPSPIPSRPGEVSSRHLSYPQLSAPWEKPEPDLVPFGTYVVAQRALDQKDYDGPGQNWVSSVIVADLMSGDGFGSAQIAAELSNRCILGKFYGDNKVDQSIVVSAERTVAGHRAWYIESTLHFSIPGLNATSEQLLIMVVNVGEGSYSMFYGSVPNTSAARLPEARQAMAHLKVYP